MHAASGPRRWAVATLALSAAAFASAVAMAPTTGDPPGAGLVFLLFVGSSMHVASTGWFVSSRSVRSYARANPSRYLVAPTALVVTTAAIAAAMTPSSFQWLLLGFFAWQFFHFQKQNVGIAALASTGSTAGTLRRAERAAIVATGVAGIVGLVAHPELLQLGIPSHARFVFVVAAIAYLAALGFGVTQLFRRPPTERAATFAATYASTLFFFSPVFLFHSPYAAVAGITIAHGLQYLLLMSLVAGGEATRDRRAVSGLILFNIALLGGVGLNAASHLHNGTSPQRVVFGAYLGVVMAHFVVDAGLWRLRDEFPRRFLQARVPYLVTQPPPQLPAAPAPNALDMK